MRGGNEQLEANVEPHGLRAVTPSCAFRTNGTAACRHGLTAVAPPVVSGAPNAEPRTPSTLQDEQHNRRKVLGGAAVAVAFDQRLLLMPYRIVLDRADLALLQNWKKTIDETIGAIRRTLDQPHKQEFPPQDHDKILQLLADAPREEETILLAIAKFVSRRTRRVSEYTHNLYLTGLRAALKTVFGGNYHLSDMYNPSKQRTCVDKAAVFDVLARMCYGIHGEVKRTKGLTIHHHWREKVENGSPRVVFDNYYGRNQFGYFPTEGAYDAEVRRVGPRFLRLASQDLRTRVRALFGTSLSPSNTMKPDNARTTIRPH